MLIVTVVSCARKIHGDQTGTGGCGFTGSSLNTSVDSQERSGGKRVQLNYVLFSDLCD